MKQELKEKGFFFISNCHQGISIEKVAYLYGKPLTPWQDGLVQDLVPRISSAPNTYSGIHGFNRFPFHTDLAHWRRPPRYVLLRCLIGFSEIPTLLLDAHDICDSAMQELLTRAIFKPRRPLDGKVSLLRLREPIDDEYCYRWDETFLIPASPIGKLASRGLKELFAKANPISISLVQNGDTLLIDNWRMLHARSSIPMHLSDRKIQRVYLEDIN
jgi:hypothetical protein